MPGDLLSDQTLLYLVYLGIGIGVLLAATALRNVLSRRETTGEARSRRMKMIHAGTTIEERIALLKPPGPDLRAKGLPFLASLPALLRRSGLALTPLACLFLCLGLGAAAFAGLALHISPALAAGAAVVLGFGLPYAALRLRLRHVTHALILQLPDALDLMARGLRVGHPLNTSIGAVAEEMPDPIGSEFGLIYDQVNYGEELPDAFQDFAERVQIEDVYYLAAAIGIQHGTGSDLARVVEVLAKVVRSRIMMRRKIRAISAEGRATAAFLSVVPLLMFGFTSFTAPAYYGGVMDDPLFVPMAVAVGLLTVLNALLMHRLVNFHV
jgi:tight adherence protein B